MKYKGKRVQTMFRIPLDEFQLLRKMAYLREVPLNTIICEAINEKLEKERKVLHNSQIVLT